MLMVISCRSRLLAQVPPLPSVVERPVSYSGGIDDNVARRPSTRLMTVPITSDEVHNFPDDMSDVIPEPPSTNPPVSTGPRRLELFQLPHEIIAAAQNLNMDNEQDESLLNWLDLRVGEQPRLNSDNSTTHFQNQFTNELETSNMDTLVSTTVDCRHPGHELGTVFNINSNEDFDMIQAFPNNLASMTRIIQTCRQTGVPLYIVDLMLKVISEEVLSGKLNLNDYPSYDTTMKRLSKLFSVPKPSIVSIPLERTVAEQDWDIFHRSPVFPVFSFVEQLQDLLSLTQA
jgi:hypothetical protein